MKLTVGTYGTNSWQIDLADDFSVLKALPLAVENASYLCKSDDGRYLFAITESGDNSRITSFLSDSPSKVVSSIECEAPDPCYIVCNRGFLYTADYSGGSISVYPAVEGKIGNLLQRVRFDCRGPHPSRQLSSHVHMLKINGDTMYATDLGGDKIHILTIGKDGKLTHTDDIQMREGCGPRHLDISADGRFLYVLTELSKELYVFDNLRPIQIVKLGDPSLEKQNGGDIHLHPGGMYLYLSLRDGDDGIVSFYIKPQSGTVTRRQFLPTGAHPRNFAILEDKELMAVFCKNSKCVQLYDLDSRTGLLGDMRKEISLPSESDSPVFGVFE